MSRVDPSHNFTSNFHTFLNKRFASAKLDQISGVKQHRDQNSILTVTYIFSPQPWPQSRQVMLAVMGRGLGNFCAWPSSIACDSVLGEKWLCWVFWLWVQTFGLIFCNEALRELPLPAGTKAQSSYAGRQELQNNPKLLSLGTHSPHSCNFLQLPNKMFKQRK